MRRRWEMKCREVGPGMPSRVLMALVYRGGPREEKAVTDRMLTGKCFCGAVEYSVSDAFLYATNCHCSNCRRTTGSAFKPFAGIERAKFTVTKGADGLLVSGSDKAHAAHCRR